MVKPVLRFPLGSFGDLDRAKAEGAVSEAPADPPPPPEKVPEPQPAEDEKQRVPVGAFPSLLAGEGAGEAGG